MVVRQDLRVEKTLARLREIVTGKAPELPGSATPAPVEPATEADASAAEEQLTDVPTAGKQSEDATAAEEQPADETSSADA